MQISNNPNSELDSLILQGPDFIQAPEAMKHLKKQFQEIMMMYNCAIREVRTKLEVLNDDLSVRNKRNPIELIKSRVKRPDSIMEKLERKGYEVTLESMVNNLDDVAGIRVICSFLDDIYDVADMLVRPGGSSIMKIIAIKDYIKNPKDNGYRSYHMIVEIPVYFSDKTLPMRVEIQIRTMAMDFWASLEHQLRYKKGFDEPNEISKKLKECADVIASTDATMLGIRKSIENKGLDIRRSK